MAVRARMLTPMQVGAVAWRAPDPALTLIVKVTFSLERDGVAAFAPIQEPVREDDLCDSEDGELVYASDFVPRKRRVDVLLRGHAQADQPATTIDFALQIDSYARRLQAVSQQPSEGIPLLPRFLRDPTTGSGTRVGPRADWDPRCTFPIDSLRFDFGVFNAAPADQTLARLGDSAVLVLSNLLPGAACRTVQLPGLRPVLFAPDLSPRPLPLPIRLDTLAIDTDAATVSLVFRTTVETRRTDVELVVGVLPSGGQTSWEAVEPEAARARSIEVAGPTPLEGSASVARSDDATEVMTDAGMSLPASRAVTTPYDAIATAIAPPAGREKPS